MDFYIDFEAYQYSQRVLSIGCEASNGAKFSCIIRGEDDKITPFIEGLTGITQQQVDEEGVSPDTAFYELGWFILHEAQWSEDFNINAPKFYCYGDCDVKFVKNTHKKYLTNPLAIMCANTLENEMIDYSKVVRKYLMTNAISLKKVLSLIEGEEVEQKHDALEDATMLRKVAENLTSLEPLNDVQKKVKVENPQPQNVQQKERVEGKTWLQQWAGCNRWNAYTGTPDNWEIMWSRSDIGDKYFESLNVFALWYVTYISGKSPKDKSRLQGVKTGVKYCLEHNNGLYKNGQLTVNKKGE